MATDTATIVIGKAKEFYNKIRNNFEYLYGRWLDESEYEDWNEYKATFEKLCETHGGKFKSAAKRPFALTVELQQAGVTPKGRVFSHILVTYTATATDVKIDAKIV